MPTQEITRYSKIHTIFMANIEVNSYSKPKTMRTQRRPKNIGFRWIRTIAFFSCTILSASCGLRDEPESGECSMGDECEGTTEKTACLQLTIRADPDIRKDKPDKLKGKLHGAVYKGGDVGALGPGDNENIYGDEINDVDLSTEESAVTMIFPNIQARDYQVLMYIDANGDDEANIGEIVTFPTDPFDAPANVKTCTEITLDTPKYL